MSMITLIDGSVVAIDESSIVRVTGHLPNDPAQRTYIFGPAPSAPLITAVTAKVFVAQLGVNPSLAILTRPDAQPVWVKGSAVTMIRPPVGTEAPGIVNAVLEVGGNTQAVRESVTAARNTVNAHGGAL